MSTATTRRRRSKPFVAPFIVPFVAALVAAGYCQPAYVMMAGASPDSPAARVDANTVASPFSGVGSVVVSGASFSGVVVAPRYVLTASHVASAPATAIQFVLNFGGDHTQVIPALAVAIYPGAGFPYDDRALVELATPVPNGVAIYPLVRTPIATGQRITLVGYGASGNGDVGPTVAASSTVKRAGQNIVDAIQTTLDASGRTSLFYIYDFDGPTGAGASGGGTLGNAVETVVAGGDSGGPAFIGSAGSYRLVGINTFQASSNGQPVDNRFGTLGGGVLLTRPEFLNWIDATTNYTTVGSSNLVDAPTLPEWALIFGVCLMGAMLVRRERARNAVST